MQVSIVTVRRKFYLKLELFHQAGTSSVYTSDSLLIPDGQMEYAQAYASEQDPELLTGDFRDLVIQVTRHLHKLHAKRIRKAEMRQIDVVPLKPRLVSTAPTPINQRFYWRRMSTIGRQTYGSPTSVNSSSAAERKRKQDADRKQKNESVKRDYRLTPKN